MANIFTVLSSELSIALVEPRLLDAVTRNVCKTVSLFCVKSEGCVDSEASQVNWRKTQHRLYGLVSLKQTV